MECTALKCTWCTRNLFIEQTTATTKLYVHFYNEKKPTENAMWCNSPICTWFTMNARARAHTHTHTHTHIDGYQERNAFKPFLMLQMCTLHLSQISKIKWNLSFEILKLCSVHNKQNNVIEQLMNEREWMNN